MSRETWLKKLGKLSDLYKANKPIWYRRYGFYAPEHRDTEPRWHLFKDRKKVPDDPYSFTWVAQCGYQYKFSEFMMEEHPQLKLGKLKPPVKDRCTRCTTPKGEKK